MGQWVNGSSKVSLQSVFGGDKGWRASERQRRQSVLISGGS